MKKSITGIVVIGFIIIILILFTCVFIVDETEMAVVMQFGKIVRSIKKPGLYLKLPSPIQVVKKFDDRLLDYDVKPRTLTTGDKKYLIVDNFAKWRIEEPEKFLKKVQTETMAQSILDDIVYSVLRVEMAKHSLIDIVKSKRAEIMSTVTAESNKRVSAYGIRILDVRIKRADLPPENSIAVFRRMKAERERQAKRYRSEGVEKAMEIKAEADRKRAQIISKAQKEAERIRGEGDAEAIKIYAEAFQKDKDFYEFYRTLKAYMKIFDKKSTFIGITGQGFTKFITNIAKD